MCSIEKIPFRGAPCSDAAGKQKTYSWIMKQVNSSMSGRLWDQGQQAPYFNYEVGLVKTTLGGPSPISSMSMMLLLAPNLAFVQSIFDGMFGLPAFFVWQKRLSSTGLF